jgi:lysyl-tRNA synthetase class 1
MSNMNQDQKPPDPIVIPPAVEEVIQRFEQPGESFTVHDIQQALSNARRAMEGASEAESFAVWSEVLAFALVVNRTGASPWGTFFAPVGSGTDKDGNVVYFPDIASANAAVIDHWAERARRINHPVLKARYADLVWDLAPVIARRRRDPDMARLAADAYLASALPPIMPALPHRLDSALRAFDLARFINDHQRTEAARERLLALQREAVAARKGLWWRAYDRLMDDRSAGLSNEQREELVDGLEELAREFGDASDPKKFNPHALENAASRLIRYYARLRRREEVRRLHVAVARAFEHFARLGNAAVASSVLQTAVNAYRHAGMPEESRRVRVFMEEKIRQAREEMAPISTEYTISHEDIDKFCASIVVDNLTSTLVRFAAAFLPKRNELEEYIEHMLKNTPFFALMPQQLMADGHVAANIGSVENDLPGRLLQQATMGFGLSQIWLQETINKLFETHDLTPDHFATWANRTGIFEDITFVREGVQAWFAGDLSKAVHVLVPQAERGLRGIADQLGHPVTKAHPAVAGAGVALTMGDVLYTREIADRLGPDISLYFLALYADPRGYNLRNQVAHGLIKPEQVSEHLANLVVHTFLVFGVWPELADKRH